MVPAVLAALASECTPTQAQQGSTVVAGSVDDPGLVACLASRERCGAVPSVSCIIACSCAATHAPHAWLNPGCWAVESRCMLSMKSVTIEYETIPEAAQHQHPERMYAQASHVMQVSVAVSTEVRRTNVYLCPVAPHIPAGSSSRSCVHAALHHQCWMWTLACCFLQLLDVQTMYGTSLAAVGLICTTGSNCGSTAMGGVSDALSQATLISAQYACAQHWCPDTVLVTAVGLFTCPFAQLGLLLHVRVHVRVCSVRACTVSGRHR
jgi:hypothetical protein